MCSEKLMHSAYVVTARSYIRYGKLLDDIMDIRSPWGTSPWFCQLIICVASAAPSIFDIPLSSSIDYMPSFVRVKDIVVSNGFQPLTCIPADLGFPLKANSIPCRCA
jgi:hypothetical protein